MKRDELKAFILDFYQAWKDRDPDKVRKFYDNEVKAFVDFKSVSLEDMMERLEFSNQKFSKAEYNVENLLIDEIQGKVAVRLKQHYVFKENGEELSCDNITLYTIKDNKLVEIWMSFYPNVDYHDND